MQETTIKRFIVAVAVVLVAGWATINWVAPVNG